MNSKYKKIIGISILICIVLSFAYIAYSFSTWGKYRMDDFDKSNLSELSEISSELFDLIDTDLIEPSSDNIINEEIRGLFGEYNEGITSIYLVEPDVIFISYGAFFQSVSGMVFVRNDVGLKDSYELLLDHDNGTIRYEKMTINIFRYTAGL